MKPVMAAILFGGLVLAVAGCGGGGSSNTSAISTVTVTTTEPASTDTTSTDTTSTDATETTEEELSGDSTDTTSTTTAEQDCSAIGTVASDLEFLAALGDGFDYAADKEFLDGYASRAPAPIADAVNQLRDLMDKLAPAAEAAGMEDGKTLLPEQADKFRSVMGSFSSEEQESNDRAIATIDTWTSNGCS